MPEKRAREEAGGKIVSDIFGPLPTSLKGNVYLLVIMDVGTREMMLEDLPTRAAVGVAKALCKRMYLSGRAPKVFQSDLAKNFVSKIVSEGGKFIDKAARTTRRQRDTTQRWQRICR